MKETFNTKDATGKEIVIGEKYGYSQSTNGYSDVRIGIAKSFTPKGLLTLTEVKATRSLYNDEAIETGHKGTCSVKPSMLFKIV
ncbi:gp140 [Sphingomonas phage PAU]|uniref:gp140 n=1 Tax=Sphingomonas phage PAU TaxID=1150991 RepID=UPI00025732D8|nr:gp140 [Sphingomonas phage PAU]AFF28138.1 gp140 [Sphingomonas phage PAU]